MAEREKKKALSKEVRWAGRGRAAGVRCRGPGPPPPPARSRARAGVPATAVAVSPRCPERSHPPPACPDPPCPALPCPALPCPASRPPALQDKAEAKRQKDAAEAKYKYAIVDGRQEQVRRRCCRCCWRAGGGVVAEAGAGGEAGCKWTGRRGRAAGAGGVRGRLRCDGLPLRQGRGPARW